MATAGSIIIRFAVKTAELAQGLAQAGNSLDAVAERSSATSARFSQLQAQVRKAGEAVATTTEAYDKASAVVSRVGVVAKVTGGSIATVARSIEAVTLAARAASLASTLLWTAFSGLLTVAKAIAAPFVIVARAIKAVAGTLLKVAPVITFVSLPLGRLITVLKMFIAVASGALFVLKGLSLAFRTLRAVLTLNVFALAANVAKMLALAAATAAVIAVKVATAGFNAFKSVLNTVAQAAAGAAVGLGILAFRAGSTIDQAGDMADQLGTTTADLLKLRYAAKLTGSSGEALDGALAKLNANLGDAATKGGPAADALARLGLDARQLVAIDPTAAFEAISSSLTTIKTPAERAAIAMDLFGRGGLSVLTTLQAGPAEIQRLGAEFESFGGAVSEAGRQSVASMFDAFDRIGAVVSGFGAQIATKAAPYVIALADAFVSLASSGGNAGGLLESAIDGVAVAVEYVGHAIDFARLGWFGFQSIGLKALAQVAYGVGRLGAGFASVINLIPGMNVTLGSTATAMGDELDRLAAEADGKLQQALAGKSFGESFKSAFDKVRAGANAVKPPVDAAAKALKKTGDAAAETAGKVADLISKLKEERDTFGMSSAAAEVYKLRQAGASAETLKNAENIAAEIRALEQGKKRTDKIASDAADLFDSTRTPLEKFQAELRKIENLRSEGAISADLAGRGAAAAKTDFFGENSKKNAAALEFGSQSARTAILEFRGQSRDKPLNEVAKNTKESAKANAAATALLERLVGKVERLTGEAAPVF